MRLTRWIAASGLLLASGAAVAGPGLPYGHDDTVYPDDIRAVSDTRTSDLTPEQVRLVQRSINGAGFDAGLSGTFDDRTRSALSEYQRARGLDATGTLDGRTLQSLGIDPHQVMPVSGMSYDFELYEHGT